ncbi:MAG: sugar transferase [Candidatus Helarchaeota archaeon]|nr:sugar transferase [Candidatus Helarchaeota archaeon]
MKIVKHKFYLAILDLLIFNGSFLLAYYINFSSGLRYPGISFPTQYLPSTFLFSFAIPIFFQLSNLYKYQLITQRAKQASVILKGYLQVLFGFIVLSFLTKTEYIVQSRLTIGLAFMIGFLFTVVVRCYIVRWFYFKLIKAEKVGKRALIIGTGEEARQVQLNLDSSKESYFQIVGFCDLDPAKVGQRVGNYLILGTLDEIEKMINRYKVQEILIAVPDQDHLSILQVIERCKEAGTVIHVISDLYKTVTDKLESEVFGNLRTFRIASRSNGLVRDGIKRTMDVIGSIILLVILSPILLLLSLLIKINSVGPILYKRKVVGKDGKDFTFYKFRTMVANNDDLIHRSFMKDFIQGNLEKPDTFYLKNDSRITRVGKWLRKFSLDELPQLFNVLMGDMSLVGPRPANKDEVKHYKEWHKKRLEGKPGVTGLWQVRARSAVKYDDMVAIDLYYLENRSFWLDVEILLQTIPVVLFGHGARV